MSNAPRSARLLVVSRSCNQEYITRRGHSRLISHETESLLKKISSQKLKNWLGTTKRFERPVCTMSFACISINQIDQCNDFGVGPSMLAPKLRKSTFDFSFHFYGAPSDINITGHLASSISQRGRVVMACDSSDKICHRFFVQRSVFSWALPAGVRIPSLTSFFVCPALF